LLGEGGGVVGAEGGVTGDHAEVIGKGGCLARLVVEKVVGNHSTCQRRYGAVLPLEVELRDPVVTLIFLDGDGGA